VFLQFADDGVIDPVQFDHNLFLDMDIRLYKAKNIIKLPAF